MNDGLDRLKSLVTALSDALDAEHRQCKESLTRLRDALRALQADTADRRLRQLAQDVDALDARVEGLVATRCRELLAQAGDALRQLEGAVEDAAVGAVVRRLEAGATPLTLPSFCERFLAAVLESTAAERGFVLFCSPDSTEAQVVAPRELATIQLARREHAHSRTLVERVVRNGQPLLLSDAADHPELLEVKSVQRLQLNSVLVAPLRHQGRTLGAVYLENHSLSQAFHEGTLRFVEAAARFAVASLHRARLLPASLPHGTSLFLDEAKSPRQLIGNDPKILTLHARIERVAGRGVHVLIEGESGTGKELVARALHDRSPRRAGPFVPQNCAAFPADLFEAELFGYEKGAFTGATERYAGLVEQARGGTLFLDEIHELPYPLQPKLLRLLDEGEFRPLRGTGVEKADVQVIAASSKSLRELVQAGKFHDALYYRLEVITLTVPPLRERRDDVGVLIDHFLSRFCEEHGKTMRVDRDVYERLARYDFPGNVRQLRNILWRCVLLAEGDLIRAEDLPPEVLQPRAAAASPASADGSPPQSPPSSLEELRGRRREARILHAEQERAIVEQEVRLAGGNVTEAAARLGMNRVTLHKILRRGRTTLRKHNRSVGRIFLALETYNRNGKRGRVMTNETGIVVTNEPATVRGADVLFISYDRLSASEDWEGFLRHRPELVVEVLATDDSSRKIEDKVAAYHAFGVDMVWVADPQTLSVHVYPNGGQPSVLRPTDEVTGGDFLPGFRCEVSEFFTD